MVSEIPVELSTPTLVGSHASKMHASITPRAIYTMAAALIQMFAPQASACDGRMEQYDDVFTAMEAVLQIEHSASLDLLARMESLEPFAADATFLDSLATFITNLLIIQANVNVTEEIPAKPIRQALVRLNRLLQSRGNVDPDAMECEMLLARAEESTAIGA